VQRGNFIFDIFAEYFSLEAEFIFFIFENLSLGILIFSAFLLFLLYSVVKYILRFSESKEKLKEE